jgi:hypothetical protein
MLAVYPQLCRRGLAEYSLLYIFPVLVQPFLQLKKVRRCEAQAFLATYFGYLAFFIWHPSSGISVQVKLVKKLTILKIFSHIFNEYVPRSCYET